MPAKSDGECMKPKNARTRIKTCNGCAALQMNQYDVECRLGFNVRQLELRGIEIVANGGIGPIGDDGICPKPRNNSDFYYWLKFYQFRR